MSYPAELKRCIQLLFSRVTEHVGRQHREGVLYACSSTALEWAANYAVACPTDPKLVGIVGDHPEGVLWDSSSGRVVTTLLGHLDYSFAAAWHPIGHLLATGNQASTSCLHLAFACPAPLDRQADS